MPIGNTVSEEGKAQHMIDSEKAEKLLKALADKSRLQILECIQEGTSNPGEIAKDLNRHRSTIEKHLRVLLAARIVEKVPSLTKGGQLSVRYKVRENAVTLLAKIREAIKEDLG